MKNKDIMFAAFMLASHDIIFNQGKVTLEVIKLLNDINKEVEK